MRRDGAALRGAARGCLLIAAALCAAPRVEARSEDFPRSSEGADTRTYLLGDDVLQETAGLGVGLGAVLLLIMSISIFFQFCMHIDQFCGRGEDEALPGEGHLSHMHQVHRVLLFVKTKDLTWLLLDRADNHKRRILWISFSLLVVSSATAGAAVYQHSLDIRENVLERGLVDAQEGVADFARFLCNNPVPAAEAAGATCVSSSVVGLTVSIPAATSSALGSIQTAILEIAELKTQTTTVEDAAEAELGTANTYYKDLYNGAEALWPACEAALSGIGVNTSACSHNNLTEPGALSIALSDCHTAIESIKLGLGDIEGTTAAAAVAALQLTEDEFVRVMGEVENTTRAEYHDTVLDYEDVQEIKSDLDGLVDRYFAWFLLLLFSPPFVLSISMVLGYATGSPKPLGVPLSFTCCTVLPFSAIAGITLLGAVYVSDFCIESVHFSVARTQLRDFNISVADRDIPVAPLVEPLATCDPDNFPLSGTNNWVDLLEVADLFEFNITAPSNGLAATASITRREGETGVLAATSALYLHHENGAEPAPACLGAPIALECSNFTSALEDAAAEEARVLAALVSLNQSLANLSDSILAYAGTLDPQGIAALDDAQQEALDTARGSTRCGFVSNRYQTLVKDTICNDIYASLRDAAWPTMLLLFVIFSAFMAVLFFMPTYIGDAEYRKIAQELKRRKRNGGLSSMEESFVQPLVATAADRRPPGR